MKVSNDIFDLIKSLGKQEKRYFKLFMEMNGGNRNVNLIDLFDAIDKQSEYDEEKLKNKFKGRKFVNQIHVAKNRLYQAVLKSLNFYYSENTAEDTVVMLLHQAEILMDRTLFDQGKKRLEKALKLSRDNELQLYEIKIHILYLTHFGERHNLDELKIQHTKSYELSLNLFRQYKNYMDLHLMRAKILEFMANGNVGGNKINDLFTAEELKKLSGADHKLSFRELEEQHAINSVYYRFLKDTEKSYECRKKLVDLMEGNMEKIKGKGNGYITALFNLLVMEMEKGLYDDALATLDKLKSLKKSRFFKLSDSNLLKLEIRIATSEMVVHSNRNEYQMLFNKIPEYLGMLNAYGSKVSAIHQLIILHFIAFTYFICEKYNDATSILYRLLYHDSIEYRKDIQSLSMLINLVCFYEIGNANLLESTIKSTYRFFQKKKNLLKTEDELIKMIRKASNLIKDSDESKDLFAKSLAKFEDINKNFPEEKYHLDGLKIIPYLKSKVENVSILEVIQKDDNIIKAEN